MKKRELQRLLKIDNLCYAKVYPTHFVINGEVLEELYIGSYKTLYLRKYWREGKLVCYSTDTIKGKNGKACEKCEFLDPGDVYHSPCQLKLRLTWSHKGEKCALELPNTGIRNFLKMEMDRKKRYRNISTLVKSYVVPRSENRWGEVRFELCVIP